MVVPGASVGYKTLLHFFKHDSIKVAGKGTLRNIAGIKLFAKHKAHQWVFGRRKTGSTIQFDYTCIVFHDINSKAAPGVSTAKLQNNSVLISVCGNGHLIPGFPFGNTAFIYLFCPWQGVLA